MLSIIFGVMVFVFLLFDVLTSDPTQMMLGQRSDLASAENIRKEMGFDQPIGVRFVRYVNDVLPLSVHHLSPENKKKYHYYTLLPLGKQGLVLKKPYLRRSYQSNELVTQILVSHFIGTLWLTFMALTFATFFGIILGVVAALRPKSVLDYTIILLANINISMPAFFVALLFSWLFGYVLADITHLPMTGYWVQLNPETLSYHWDIRYIILPALALGLRPLAIITALARSTMLEVLQQDYIRTAKAKGLSYYQVIVRHALRNALNPVVSAVSNWLASLMAGSFFVEYMFSWKGIGYVTVQALEQQDFPIVMGAVLVLGIFFTIVNFMTDILYRYLDPRIKAT